MKLKAKEKKKKRVFKMVVLILSWVKAFFNRYVFEMKNLTPSMIYTLEDEEIKKGIYVLRRCVNGSRR